MSHCIVSFGYDYTFSWAHYAVGNQSEQMLQDLILEVQIAWETALKEMHREWFHIVITAVEHVEAYWAEHDAVTYANEVHYLPSLKALLNDGLRSTSINDTVAILADCAHDATLKTVYHDFFSENNSLSFEYLGMVQQVTLETIMGVSLSRVPYQLQYEVNNAFNTYLKKQWDTEWSKNPLLGSFDILNNQHAYILTTEECYSDFINGLETSVGIGW